MTIVGQSKNQLEISKKNHYFKTKAFLIVLIAVIFFGINLFNVKLPNFTISNSNFLTRTTSFSNKSTKFTTTLKASFESFGPCNAKLIQMRQEKLGQFANKDFADFPINADTWSFLDSIDPQGFELCMRRFAREFHADTILRDRNGYPVPFSIFSRGNTIFTTVFHQRYANKAIPEYDKWLLEYVWKVKIKNDSDWKLCSTAKGKSGHGDSTHFVIGLECPNIVPTRYVGHLYYKLEIFSNFCSCLVPKCQNG